MSFVWEFLDFSCISEGYFCWTWDSGVDSSFLSACEKWATSFWPSYFVVKINHHSIFSLNEVASLLLLRVFFVFSFQKFDYNVSWHGFWGVYLVWDLLDFLTVGLQFLPNLGNFQMSILHIFFPAPPSFWSLSGTQWQECWIFYYSLLKPRLCSFSFSVCFLFDIQTG